MPVYGLPSALESSLNSLAHARPPTSWRVSSHGNDVTVVLRWTQCVSPSSDQTVHYNIDHDPKERLRNASFSWRHQFSQDSDPLTSTSSALDGRVSKISTKFDADFQPVKRRSIDTSYRRQRRTSPVPLFITSSSAASEKQTANNELCPMAVYNDLGEGNVSKRSAQKGHENGDKGGYIKEGSSGCDPSVILDTPSPSESCHDLEIRAGIRSYLSHKSPEASTDQTFLDEKNGIIVMNSQASCVNQSYRTNSEYVSSNTNRNRLSRSESSTQLSSKPNSLTKQLSRDLESPVEIIDECLDDLDTVITPARVEGRRCSGLSASGIKSPATQSCTLATSPTKDVVASSSPANMFMVSEDDLQPCDLEIVCSVDSDGCEGGSTPGKHSPSDWDSFEQIHESGDSESTESSFDSVNDELGINGI